MAGFGSLASGMPKQPKVVRPKKPKKIHAPEEHQQHIGGPYQSPVETYHSMLDQPATTDGVE